jgi:hypothetical protein
MAASTTSSSPFTISRCTSSSSVSGPFPVDQNRTVQSSV